MKPPRSIWLLLLAALVLAILLSALHYFSGERRLTALKRQLAGQGERLKPEQFNRPQSTNEHNFVRLIEATSRLVKGGVEPGSVRLMDIVSPGKARVAWVQAEVPASGKLPPTWEQVASLIQSNGAALAEIKAALADPPLVGGWDYRNLMAGLNPRWIDRRTAAQWLALEAIHHLREGALESALAALTAISSLARLHEEEPPLINLMIRSAISSLGTIATWEALQAQGWDDSKLRRLQDAWTRVDLLRGTAAAFELERAQGLEIFAFSRKFGVLRTRQHVFGGAANSNAFLAALDGLVVTPARNLAWASRDELDFLNGNQTLIDLARQGQRERSWRAIRPLLAAELARYEKVSRLLPFQEQLGYSLGHDLVPNFFRAMETLYRNETHRSLTVAAIALARHRLKHGAFPPSLDALVPELLPALPTDFMDGRPLRYRLGLGSGYVLYSVGPDGVDDNGDPTPATGGISWSGAWQGRDAVWPEAIREQGLNP